MTSICLGIPAVSARRTPPCHSSSISTRPTTAVADLRADWISPNGGEADASLSFAGMDFLPGGVSPAMGTLGIEPTTAYGTAGAINP